MAVETLLLLRFPFRQVVLHVTAQNATQALD